MITQGSKISLLTVFFLLTISLAGFGQQTGSIEGLIKDSETNHPIEGVNVNLEGSDRGATTSGGFPFKIDRLSPGQYTLAISHVGYQSATQTVTVRSGETTNIEVFLTKQISELDNIIVEGRTVNLVGTAMSASQGRVGRAQLRTRPLLRTGEVMETIPGLIATQHSGSGKGNQFFLRGFNLDHGTDFSTSLEGMPLNLRSHGHGQGYLDINFLIPEVINVVEFRKGPYFADVGDFATAGNAQVGLADRLDESIVSLEAGMDEYYRGLVAGSSESKYGNLLYGLNARYYNGPFNEPENAAKLTGILKFSNGNKLNGYSLTGLAFDNNWNSSDQIPKRAVQNGELSRFGTIDPSNGGETGRYALIGNWWTSNNEYAQTKATVYSTYYFMNLFSNFTYSLEDPVNGDQFEQVDRRLISGGSLSHHWLTNWFGHGNKNAIGMDIQVDRIFEVGLHQTIERNRINTVRDDVVNESSLGLYLENETKWIEKLRTTIGMRGDVFLFDVNSNINVNSGTKTDFIGSPKFTLTLGPWYHTEYYFNLGMGYHSNDARGTTIMNDPSSGQPLMPVDPLVRSKGAEIGARTTLIKGLQSTLALFYIGLDSELVFVGDAGGTEASGASQHQGLEWTNYYKPNPWLSFNLDVALTDSKFTEEDSNENAIPNSLGRVITGGISAELPSGLFAGLRLRHNGPSPLVENGMIQSGESTLLNIKAGYEFKHFTLELNVLNALNSQDTDISYYYASRLPGEAAEGIEDVHFHPVLSRTARFAFTWDF
ncbi:MAG: TonB-dependent receptor [Balneolales bacterium]